MTRVKICGCMLVSDALAAKDARQGLEREILDVTVCDHDGGGLS